MSTVEPLKTDYVRGQRNQPVFRGSVNRRFRSSYWYRKYKIFISWRLIMLWLCYSWLSLSRTRLTRISGWVEFLSTSRTSLCINIYNLTPVESNSDESKFRLSRIKVLVARCRKPYYLHTLSRTYLSKHVYYLGIKIGSQVKHPVIDFDIFTSGYFTCLFHNLSN
jgi:hypothetical protein